MIQYPPASYLLNNVKSTFETFTGLDFEEQLMLVRDEIFPTEDNIYYHQNQMVVTTLIDIIRESDCKPLADNVQMVCNGFLFVRSPNDQKSWDISCDSFSCHLPAFEHLEFEDMSCWLNHCQLADKYLRDVCVNCPVNEFQRFIWGCCVILCCFVPEYRQYWKLYQADNEQFLMLILYAFAVCIAFTNWQAFRLNQLLEMSV